MPAPSPRNRLAQEASPYLRQHAENPVDWYPWGDEALERARREERPILLSIGYSACHWCHVMAHECFEDPAIARLMNEWFVNVKVDREERPDLDQLYQGVVQLMGRGGGWPLTVFLTPDLRPFYGGTYFPPEDRFGMPGFPRLLESLHEAWERKKDDVEAQASLFRSGLAQLSAHGLDASPAEPRPEDIVAAAEALGQEADRVHGGFVGTPKFPNPASVALLLRGWRRSRRGALLDGALLTLEKMARGGIYDQLGGGFHRYSVDERWRVPHFEKMLYDNALLLHLYSEAQLLAPRPLWRKVVEETVEYVGRELTSPDGELYAAQDADSEGVEGKFFVWKPAELDAALSPDDARLARAHFGVHEGGNFEHGASVLELAKDAEALAEELGRPLQEVEADLARIRAALFRARSARVAPDRDDKVLAGWNGLMIRGLAFASRAFGRGDWLAKARRAADSILARLWTGDRLYRSHRGGAPRIDGFLEDYGQLASGLVSLYQASFEPRYLEEAERLSLRAVELFWDDERSAYLAAPRGQKDLLVPTYSLHDGAVPSGASCLAEVQVALAALTGRARHLEQAGRYLRRMREEALRNPFGFCHLLLAADAWLDGAAEVTLVGRAGFDELLSTVNRTWAPTVALSARRDSEPVPPVLAEAMEGRAPVGGRAAAYLCRSFTCQAPLTEPAELERRLREA